MARPDPNGPRLLLFDLYNGGHNAQYLLNLITFWAAHDLDGELHVVVPAATVRDHPVLRERTTEHAARGLYLHEIEGPHPVTPGRSLADLLRNDVAHGRLLRRYLEALRPTHALMMYFDHMQFSLLWGLRLPFPVRLGGIYFRPDFHYAELGSPARSWREHLQRLRKRLVLAGALRNPHLHHLFCLDPYAAARLAGRGGPEAHALADGVLLHPAERTREAQRQVWEVDPDRRVALLFGVLSPRKGLPQVIEAVEQMEEAAQRRLCLVLAGPLPLAERAATEQRLRHLRESTGAQLVVDDRFVPEAECQALLRGADLALLPYQHHVGSSNVLVRAAAEAVPVLGAEFGLLGALIRAHGLGQVVDASSPRAIGGALTAWLRDPSRLPFDAWRAQRYAQANTAEVMASTIFRAFGQAAPHRGPLPSPAPTAPSPL